MHASGRILTVVEVRHMIGQGTGADPAREIIQFFDAEGTLLATHDDWYVNQHAALQRDLYAELTDTYGVLSADSESADARNLQQRVAYATGGVGRCLYLLDGKTGR
jgi:hypothetical protein